MVDFLSVFLIRWDSPALLDISGWRTHREIRTRAGGPIGGAYTGIELLLESFGDIRRDTSVHWNGPCTPHRVAGQMPARGDAPQRSAVICPKRSSAGVLSRNRRSPNVSFQRCHGIECRGSDGAVSGCETVPWVEHVHCSLREDDHGQYSRYCAASIAGANRSAPWYCFLVCQLWPASTLTSKVLTARSRRPQTNPTIRGG